MTKRQQKKRCLLSLAAPNNTHTHSSDTQEQFWLLMYCKGINKVHLSHDFIGDGRRHNGS